jgi:hypothetical protein
MLKKNKSKKINIFNNNNENIKDNNEIIKDNNENIKDNNEIIKDNNENIEKNILKSSNHFKKIEDQNHAVVRQKID